jgi:hypothetical protein
MTSGLRNRLAIAMRRKLLRAARPRGAKRVQPGLADPVPGLDERLDGRAHRGRPGAARRWVITIAASPRHAAAPARTLHRETTSTPTWTTPVNADRGRRLGRGSPPTISSGCGCRGRPPATAAARAADHLAGRDRATRSLDIGSGSSAAQAPVTPSSARMRSVPLPGVPRSWTQPSAGDRRAGRRTCAPATGRPRPVRGPGLRQQAAGLGIRAATSSKSPSSLSSVQYSMLTSRPAARRWNQERPPRPYGAGRAESGRRLHRGLLQLVTGRPRHFQSSVCRWWSSQPGGARASSAT